MEYTLQRDEPVSDGVKRIVDGKVETGIDHIDSDMDRHETVHEVRKRCNPPGHGSFNVHLDGTTPRGLPTPAQSTVSSSGT